MSSKLIAALALVGCAAHAPTPQTIVVEQRPCMKVVHLGVDLSKCNWVDIGGGRKHCEGAENFVWEDTTP